MDAVIYVKELLTKALHGDSEGIYCEAIVAQNVNNETLRDLCMDLGDYIRGDEERPGYVIQINRKMHNVVFMALCCENGMLYMACKADGGILNNDSEKKAVEYVRKIINADNNKKDLQERTEISRETAVKKNKSKVLPFIIILFLIVLAGVGVFSYYRITNVDKYNTVVSDYNEVAKEYDALLLVSSVDELEGFPTHVKLKTEIPTGFEAIFTNCDVEEITEELETLLGQCVVLGQMTNPSTETIKTQIKKVEGIGEILEVTSGNDPNEMLGKEGGYTGCLYFSHELVDQEGLRGKDVIEKGTDCGGCIEIFKNKEDAENRNEYLTKFDDTVLYSGSHKVFGTLIIRTSYRLSNENQDILTDAICNAIMTV